MPDLLQSRDYRGRGYHCPVELALLAVSGKWKTAILWFLVHEGALRFNGLRDRIPEASAKVLAARLRELEQDGIVQRVEGQGRVEYSFTPLGARLMPALQALEGWAQEFEATLARAGE